MSPRLLCCRVAPWSLQGRCHDSFPGGVPGWQGHTTRWAVSDENELGAVMPQAAPARIRLTEVLSAVSLTTDLGSGMPFEKGLQTCVAASAFAAALRLSADERRAVFQAALLRA